MTDKPQLDHDRDGKAGGAKKPPAADDLVWMVSRARGLHRVPAPETAAVLRAGGRLATDRDLEIGGVTAG